MEKEFKLRHFLSLFVKNMNLHINELHTELGRFRLDIRNIVMNVGIHIIIGGNGSGKSTLFKSLIGFYATESQSEILFNNRPLFVKEDISFLPQELNRPQMTLRDFVELTSNRDSNFLLNEFDLSDQHEENIEHLSGGEFKRASFTQILLEDKPIIMLDEIEQGLDVKYKKQIFNTLRELSKEKIIILNVHDLSLVLAYADYIYGLKNGAVAFSTTPESISKDMLESIFNTKLNIIKHNQMRYITL